ncbi:hypothetical protein ACFLRT_02710, partial [Acidobacteriota bacterium]
MLKIAHIINPVKVEKSSDLYFAQPITFETIRIAKEFVENQDQLKVTLYSAQFEEDGDLVPNFFKKTTNLERSVLDLGTFKIKRKLPILKDILDNLFQSSAADYFVYTNADIGLMPHFYLAINKIITEGYDALVINRRTISAAYQQVNEIPLMYAQIGEPHIGHDCFVLKREVYPEYKLGNVCIGIRLVGRVLLWNLLAYSKKFKEFKNLHLTFHLGQNKPWKNPGLKDYDDFNKNEARKVLQYLNRKHDF